MEKQLSQCFQRNVLNVGQLRNLPYLAFTMTALPSSVLTHVTSSLAIAYLICDFSPKMVAHEVPYSRCTVSFTKSNPIKEKCVLCYALNRGTLPYFIIKMIFVSETVIQIPFCLLALTLLDRN